MSNEFHSLASDRKVIKIKSALQKADKILDNYNRQDYADSISTGDILSVLNEIDKIAAALRTAYSETVEQDKIEPIYGNLIQIDYDGNILTINVPTLINRDKKNSYYIAGTVAYALNDYIEKHDLKRPIVQTPAIISFTRFTDRLRSISDNDNAECRRVQNAICQTIGISDTADNLANCYITKLTRGINGSTKIHIIPQKLAAQYLNLIL